MRTHRFLAILAAVVSSACSAATGPDTVGPTTYMLLTANGAAAPAFVHDTTYTSENVRVQVYVTSDTVTIDGSRYTQHATLLAYGNGILAGRGNANDHGTVTRTGAALHFDSGFPQHVQFDGRIDAQGRLLLRDLSRDGQLANVVLRALP
ncbi:MAG: hypothetical protein JWL60_2509 [Gemmatimonadetes bacterium]|jgi:hypothetical protein|nr:hypothetical protein [Gemmatimonadota bacterium]